MSVVLFFTPSSFILFSSTIVCWIVGKIIKLDIKKLFQIWNGCINYLFHKKKKNTTTLLHQFICYYLIYNFQSKIGKYLLINKYLLQTVEEKIIGNQSFVKKSKIKEQLIEIPCKIIDHRKVLLFIIF
ncbi:hypothetical protein RFI_36466 [Reticulomyxa filosa]|uniref:Uncharacterized protein n=1 Tax=Reticulomyxa filosa TaxID=46433 RepID=X6LHB0_RETFI|nr:hypothetical protein RFI_36466 [Reticulomyxa filosa]|eukprot:ETO00974.1 hypothetical protein RFI_36466 [Reticulomyxa filosa]